MNDHYYTTSPDSAHHYQACRHEYRGVSLQFMTDAGVFSKGEVDFGTRVLLDALPEDVSGRVLDLGCGWGCVGVSVGKRWPDAQIVMCDVNERALGLAKDNAKKNGVQAETYLSDGFQNVPGTFRYVITNPPIRAGKQVIYGLFRQSAAALEADGELYIVIRKQQGAESAIKYLKTIFDQVETIDKSGGFWVICCRGGQKDAV
ncbi:MAG: class I SAM-dependent methyltransferase [Clostridia bacterium]|nr:class I SAM-dependent methyltransferase [Clostridia bacterium]